MLDVSEVRSRFSSPAEDFVSLDAPGGSQVTDDAGRAAARGNEEASGNMGASRETSRRSEAVVEEARSASGRFLGCEVDRVVFGADMASLDSTPSRTHGRTLEAGDATIATRLDHCANVAPWLELSRDEDLVVRHVEVRPDTTPDFAHLERLLGPRMRVVAFPRASNAVGTTVDAARACDLAHEAGAPARIHAARHAPPEPGTLPYELLSGPVTTAGYLDSLGRMAAVAAGQRRLGLCESHVGR